MAAETNRPHDVVAGFDGDDSTAGLGACVDTPLNGVGVNGGPVTRCSVIANILLLSVLLADCDVSEMPR